MGQFELTEGLGLLLISGGESVLSCQLCPGFLWLYCSNNSQYRKMEEAFTAQRLAGQVVGGGCPLGSPVYFILITSPLYPYHMRLSHPDSSCTQFSRASLGSCCLIFSSPPTAFNLQQTTLYQYAFKLFYMCNLVCNLFPLVKYLNCMEMPTYSLQ